MKLIISVYFLLLSLYGYSQKRGFEFLSYAKSSLESVIIDYSSVISDTSFVFKKYYLSLARSYNKAKGSYDGYRGAMKDCILNNNGKRKTQNCLRSKTVDIQANLDTLGSILQAAYLEAYELDSSHNSNPKYTGNNSGLITGDIIKSLLDTLINGAVKLWDESQKYKKEYRDNYLTNITSKEYDLSPLNDLLKKKSIDAHGN